MSAREINPNFFSMENDEFFSQTIAVVAGGYAGALGRVVQYERENSPEALQAIQQKAEDDATFSSLTSSLSDLNNVTIRYSEVRPIGGIKKEEYEKSLAAIETSGSLLPDYIFGYGDHMAKNLMKIYGGDAEEALPEAWTATWDKLHTIVHATGGTVLAEVVELFDNMIEWKYADTYDVADELRGPEVREDPAARTFYEVMAPHVGRSILKRKAGDEWS